jgi:SAM-dependent methyltransferase
VSVFGGVAREYDRVRPGYPTQLVDDVLAYAGPLSASADGRSASSRAGGAIVDVGAGTGRATLAFAARGHPVTAVEPDPRMAEILAGHADGLPVTVHVGTFETFTPVEAFGLLTCAQAWHWIDEARRWDLAADALRPGGAVALFANRDRPADPAVADAVRAAYATHAPDLWIEDPPLDESTMDWDEMAGQPRLVGYTTGLYRWRRTLSAEDLVAYLSTTSRHVLLDGEIRAALFRDILGRLDVPVVIDVETELHLARRRS